jgi:uncharacterized protein (UPF0335 family)
MSATERLKQFTARINRLMDERDTLTSDIGDVYQEVKSAGFSGPALRKVIAAMRMDESKRNEIEAMVEMYRAAVGLARPEAVEMLESGKTIRETNRATGVALGTLHRRSKTVQKSKTEHPERTAAHDGAAPQGEPDRAKPASPDPMPPSSAAAAPVASPLPLADAGAPPPAALDTPDDSDWERRDGAATFELAMRLKGGKEPMPEGLEPPAFLKRGTAESDKAMGKA